MQLYPSFTAQPGLKVIKKINIRVNSITQSEVRMVFYVSLHLNILYTCLLKRR